jgi:hypothetical protein
VTGRDSEWWQTERRATAIQIAVSVVAGATGFAIMRVGLGATTADSVALAFGLAAITGSLAWIIAR